MNDLGRTNATASGHGHDGGIEVQPADPQARRRAMIVLAVLTPIGLLGTGLTIAYLARVEDASVGDPEAALRRFGTFMLVGSSAAALLCIGTAAYVARICGLALRAERFPPPGVPTVREVRVMRGTSAKRMAAVGMALAGVLALAGLLLPLMVWRLLLLLGRGA